MTSASSASGRPDARNAPSAWPLASSKAARWPLPCNRFGAQLASRPCGPGPALSCCAARYDERDEREERRKDLRRSYAQQGTVYMMGVPLSMKKLQRFMRLVRGLHVSEAMNQCRMFPHKAAGFVLEVRAWAPTPPPSHAQFHHG